MSENLRDEIAEALRMRGESESLSWGSLDLTVSTYDRLADAVLAVVGPELDRLRAEAEVERLRKRVSTLEALADQAHGLADRSAEDAALWRASQRRIYLNADGTTSPITTATPSADEADWSKVAERLLHGLGQERARAEKAEVRLAAVEALCDLREQQGVVDDDGRSIVRVSDVRAMLAEPRVAPPEPLHAASDGPNPHLGHPESPEGVSGAQRGTQRFEPDADREAGERCTCGAPDAYALTPGETIVHRRDGEPCYIAQSADGASQPPVIREAGER